MDPASDFVWHKKVEQDRQSRRRLTDNVDGELESLRRRRQQREHERAERDAERGQAQRDADRAYYGDWEQREDSFQLAQAVRRAEIRARQGRARAVDLLALTHEHAGRTEPLPVRGVDGDTLSAADVVARVPIDELQGLRRDVAMYAFLGAAREFWDNVAVLCAYHETRSSPSYRISAQIQTEITELMASKSLDELAQLEQTVRGKLAGELVDSEYWEAMLASIGAAVATRGLQQYRVAIVQADEEAEFKPKPRALRVHTQKFVTNPDDPDEQTEQDAGEFAPQVALIREYAWSATHKPRKPRFVNRVSTGYEWNKYNQRHYDAANPPPKVIQGYKFNIFYPDLVDASIAPTYYVEPRTEDTLLLIFTAGPPYEDIGFEIVNREWEVSHRKGFRCIYDRGVLQLHFSFRRYYYRK